MRIKNKVGQTGQLSKGYDSRRYSIAGDSRWNSLLNTVQCICGPQTSFNKNQDGKDSNMKLFSLSICKC